MYILILSQIIKSEYLSSYLSICLHFLDIRDVMKLDDIYLLRAFIIYGRSIWEGPLFGSGQRWLHKCIWQVTDFFWGDTYFWHEKCMKACKTGLLRWYLEFWWYSNQAHNLKIYMLIFWFICSYFDLYAHFSLVEINLHAHHFLIYMLMAKFQWRFTKEQHVERQSNQTLPFLYDKIY